MNDKTYRLENNSLHGLSHDTQKDFTSFKNYCSIIIVADNNLN